MPDNETPEYTPTPAQIADIDQLLANLDEQMAGPLENLRKLIADNNGDTTIAYAKVGRELVQHLEYGTTNFRIAIGMGYAAMLVMLNRKAAK